MGSGIGKICAAGAILLSVGLARPAGAHHSFAMFDRTQEIKLKGVVKEWQFTNPHAYLQVMSVDAQPKEWSLETTALTSLLKRGLRRETFKPGDKVDVVLHPLRNNASGGELVSVTMADGMVWKLY
jgi:hypothetical protein